MSNSEMKIGLSYPPWMDSASRAGRARSSNVTSDSMPGRRAQRVRCFWMLPLKLSVNALASLFT